MCHTIQTGKTLAIVCFIQYNMVLIIWDVQEFGTQTLLATQLFSFFHVFVITWWWQFCAISYCQWHTIKLFCKHRHQYEQKLLRVSDGKHAISKHSSSYYALLLIRHLCLSDIMNPDTGLAKLYWTGKKCISRLWIKNLWIDSVRI